MKHKPEGCLNSRKPPEGNSTPSLWQADGPPLCICGLSDAAHPATSWLTIHLKFQRELVLAQQSCLGSFQ